jgi:protocatechuate 3,4-dioxygenase beta subunit
MTVRNKTIGRREAIAIISATGAALGFGCGGESPTSPTSAASTSTTTSSSATGGACVVTPNETIGPYPSLVDLFRSDIREGKGGTTLTLTISVVNTANDCTPIDNVNVEIWQCDATGNYSQYGTERAQTYLRGIQTTNSNGQVSFTTIYPGWYQGRATHIHVEVTRNGSSLKVTQIAFPESVNAQVYGSGVYSSRGNNPTSNARDMVFADGVDSEMASISGSPSDGYTATFTVGLAV